MGKQAVDVGQIPLPLKVSKQVLKNIDLYSVLLQDCTPKLSSCKDSVLLVTGLRNSSMAFSSSLTGIWQGPHFGISCSWACPPLLFAVFCNFQYRRNGQSFRLSLFICE